MGKLNDKIKVISCYMTIFFLSLQVDCTVLCRAKTQMMMGVLCTPGRLSGVGHIQTSWGCTMQTRRGGIKVKVSAYLQLGCWEPGEQHSCWPLMKLFCFDQGG